MIDSFIIELFLGSFLIAALIVEFWSKKNRKWGENK